MILNDALLEIKDLQVSINDNKILKKLKLTYYYTDGKIKNYQEDLAQLVVTVDGTLYSVYNEVKI